MDISINNALVYIFHWKTPFIVEKLTYPWSDFLFKLIKRITYKNLKQEKDSWRELVKYSSTHTSNKWTPSIKKPESSASSLKIHQPITILKMDPWKKNLNQLKLRLKENFISHQLSLKLISSLEMIIFKILWNRYNFFVKRIYVNK